MDESKIYNSTNYGNNLGVDVKVPWELARMQHLPQLALYAITRKEKIKQKKIILEIKNQFFDFISSNPPGFGINWLCPMDVGIRATNWIITLDIIYTHLNQFSKNEIEIILFSILKHGRFLLNNLEWSEDRNNHYYSNICSLTFISLYLRGPRCLDYWRSFSINEFNYESIRQFYEDGGNFEGSTAYHRMSCEMLFFTSSLILGTDHKELKVS